jgi:hypothetical protein
MADNLGLLQLLPRQPQRAGNWGCSVTEHMNQYTRTGYMYDYRTLPPNTVSERGYLAGAASSGSSSTTTRLRFISLAIRSVITRS